MSIMKYLHLFLLDDCWHGRKAIIKIAQVLISILEVMFIFTYC